MHDRLEYRLRTTFPSLFRYQGIETSIGNGWVELLARLCFALRHEPNVAFAQVKEKFGGLRAAYMRGASDQAWEKRSWVGAESFLVCERCGEDGRAASTGLWVMTLCGQCMDEFRVDEQVYGWVLADAEGD